MFCLNCRWIERRVCNIRTSHSGQVNPAMPNVLRARQECSSFKHSSMRKFCRIGKDTFASFFVTKVQVSTVECPRGVTTHQHYWSSKYIVSTVPKMRSNKWTLMKRKDIVSASWCQVVLHVMYIKCRASGARIFFLIVYVVSNYGLVRYCWLYLLYSFFLTWTNFRLVL